MFKVKTTARNEILLKIFRAAAYASRDKSFTVSLIKDKKSASFKCYLQVLDIFTNES